MYPQTHIFFLALLICGLQRRSKIFFPDYKNFENVSAAYSNFIQLPVSVVYRIAP